MIMPVIVPLKKVFKHTKTFNSISDAEAFKLTATKVFFRERKRNGDTNDLDISVSVSLKKSPVALGLPQRCSQN